MGERRRSRGTASPRGIAAQVAVVLAVGLAAAWLVNNTIENLRARGITVGYDFLDRAARFPIAESVIPYEPVDSFGWAFVVGLGNTLFLSALVIVAATVFGVGVGLARRGRHPLARALAGILVDFVRNTPLVVQLLFWYAVVTFGLPRSAASLTPLPGVHLTDRGLYLPRPAIEGDAAFFWGVIAAGGLSLALAVATGRRRSVPAIAVGTVLAAALVWLASDLSFVIESPRLGRFNFMGGITLTPEFVAAVLGLVIYSSAFVGEIVRGGIEAVPTGQWEAGRALGLSERRTLRSVVMPQALRVIVPPMTSQYINIVKNSTLALVVGYPELNFVTATTINQTGQAIEGILVLMAVFLSISAAASLLMNWYNRRIALVQR